MKLIIAGSRNIQDYEVVLEAMKSSPFNINDVDVLFSGGSEGVDKIAENIFEDNYESDISLYPVYEYIDVAPKDEVAPLIRNTQMAEDADALIAVWDGRSSGTKDMIDKARENNLDLYIHRTDNKKLSDFV